MARGYLDPPVPIVALATPPAAAALAILRATGPGCVDLLAPAFSRPRRLREAGGHSLVHGSIVDPRSGERIDEVIVAVYRAPKSPTGEEQVEISCHGSPAVWRRVLGCLESVGFAPALPGEFSFRALVAGKSDLVRSEAVGELVAARSERARAGALRRLEGGLSRRLRESRASLLLLLAEAEVRLDHAEEDGSPADPFPRSRFLALRSGLSALAASWRAGRIYREGATLVIAGRTNAGKSSLFNLLLREERAIVSQEHGTTRDWIEAGIEVGGFPVRLIDTAGLRDASGGVEAAGILRSRDQAGKADLLLCVVDAVVGPGREDEELLLRRPDAVRVWNKTDLPSALPCPAGWLPVSARSGEGLAGLLEALGGALRGVAGLGAESDPEDGDVVANPRQKALLDRAVAALDEASAILWPAGTGGSPRLDAAALELRDAADALGEITGEITSPEVLEAIFSGFCLGK